MKLTWATRITILRVLLIVPFISLMLKTNDPRLSEQVQDIFRYISVLIFLVMAVSDALDGHLARRLGQTTKLGTFLDPVADKALMMSACLLLSSQRAGVEGFLLPTTVVVLIIGKDVLLAVGFVIQYFMTFKVRVEPVLVGKLSTAFQLIMVMSVLLGPEISQIFSEWIWVTQSLWWSAGGLAVLAALVYIYRGSRYIEQFEYTNS